MKRQMAQGVFKLIKIIVLLISTPFLFGAVKRMQTSAHPKGAQFITHGTITGGYQGEGLKLVDIKRHFSKSKNYERWSFQFKPQDLKKSFGPLPAHHIALDEKNNTLSMVFKRTSLKRNNVNKIRTRVKNSSFMRDLMVDFDPFDMSTLLKFKLIKKSKLKVYKRKKNKQKLTLVIDIYST